MERITNALWKLGHPRGKSLAQNTLYTTITSAITFLGGTALFIVLGRVLSVEQFGTIELATAIGTMVALLPTYGFDLFVIRELAQKKYTSGEVVANVTIIKILLVCISLLCLYLYLLFSNAVEQPSVFWIVGISAILSSFTRFYNSILKAREDFFSETVTTTIQNLSQLVLIVVVAVTFDFTALVAAWLILISRLLAFGYSLKSVIFRKAEAELTRESRISMYMMWQFSKNAFPFAVQSFLGTAYFHADAILIGELLSTTTLGYYQAGKRLLNSFMRVSAVLMSAFYPRLAQSFAGGNEKSGDLSVSRLFTHFMILTGGTLSTFFLLFATPVIIGIYGTKMEPAIPVLRILSLIFVLRYLAGGYGLILVSSNRQLMQLTAAVLAFSLNISMNFLLIPTYGYIAAAWSSVLTNALVLGFYFVVMKRTQGTLLLGGLNLSIRKAIQYAKSLRPATR